MKKVLLLLACCALAACADQGLKNARNEVSDQPPAYQDGYVDGCSSGTKAAGNPYYTFKKDAARFDANKLYKQGWTDGFNVCKGKYDSIMNSMHN